MCNKQQCPLVALLPICSEVPRLKLYCWKELVISNGFMGSRKLGVDVRTVVPSKQDFGMEVQGPITCTSASGHACTQQSSCFISPNPIMLKANLKTQSWWPWYGNGDGKDPFVFHFHDIGWVWDKRSMNKLFCALLSSSLRFAGVGRLLFMFSLVKLTQGTGILLPNSHPVYVQGSQV